jgi:maleylacetoacetate isomerase
MALKLYNFFRNSAGHRVRIALHLKEIPFDYVSIDIRKGAQLEESYRKINPLSLIPALEDEGKVITQSTAIIEYLEDLYPEPSIFPEDPVARARSRAFAASIAAEIHALNNMRVHKYMHDELGLSDAQRDSWYRHWAHVGLTALERQVREYDSGSKFGFADTPTMGDIFLVPQVLNFRRTNLDISAYPRLMEIVDACEALPGFKKAAPETQPDYVEGQ